jgi:hypothetical protein
LECGVHPVVRAAYSAAVMSIKRYIVRRESADVKRYVNCIGAAFVVRDHNEQALAYIYYEEEPARRSAAKLLTRDEAKSARTQRRIPDTGPALAPGLFLRAIRYAPSYSNADSTGTR